MNTEYEIIESEMARLWKLPELIPTKNFALLDMTGVGAPIAEGLRRKKVPIIGIVITGGHSVNNPSPSEWHVPKSVLVTSLAKVVQTGRLKVVEGVENWKELREELGDFGYKVNRDTANIAYEALDENIHDDLVISVSLCIWYAEKNAPSAWSRTKAEIGPKYNPLQKRFA